MELRAQRPGLHRPCDDLRNWSVIQAGLLRRFIGAALGPASWSRLRRRTDGQPGAKDGTVNSREGLVTRTVTIGDDHLALISSVTALGPSSSKRSPFALRVVSGSSPATETGGMDDS